MLNCLALDSNHIFACSVTVHWLKGELIYNNNELIVNGGTEHSLFFPWLLHDDGCHTEQRSFL